MPFNVLYVIKSATNIFVALNIIFSITKKISQFLYRLEGTLLFKIFVVKNVFHFFLKKPNLARRYSDSAVQKTTSSPILFIIHYSKVESGSNAM